MPRNAELDLQADNGGIHIEDFAGRAKFSTVNGGIHLDGVGGQIEGTTGRRGHSGARIETDLGHGGRLLRLETTNGGLHVSQD